MKYINSAAQKVRVHEHPADDTCHWAHILKPLAYLIFHCADLRHLIPKAKSVDLGDREYVKWLCEVDSVSKVTNLVKLLVHVCESIPIPFVDFIE